MAASKVAHLRISGMTCSSCEGIIESVLKSEDGILAVAVSNVLGSGKVTYDPLRITAEKIVDCVNGVGYDAVLLADEGDRLSAAASTAQPTSANLLLLSVGGMTCSSCVGIIESVLKGMEGIIDASVNLTTSTGAC